jgi:hypothetical protein
VVATRNEKFAIHYLALVQISMISLLVRHERPCQKKPSLPAAAQY